MPVERGELLGALQKESIAIVRALGGAAEARAPGAADDLVLVLVEEASDPASLALPDLKDRAAAVVGVAGDAPACRAVIARARRLLRAQGAVLGARELVLPPEAFGYLGLESDGQREKLEILLRALVLDGERLRLRREGWEDPPGTDRA